MNTSTKTIVVVGATGNQGFSVAKTFLGLPGWHVRCLTRSVTSEKAQSLTTQGAEVIQGNLEDQRSLEDAFAGAHAIFVNTDFWETCRASIASGKDAKESGKLAYDTEVRHGKNAAIAATRIPTLEHFVYSALGPMKRASGGKYPNAGHCESKAAVVDYIEQEQPELSRKTSFIYIGAYSSNTFLYPKKSSSNGNYVVIMPVAKDTRFPIIDPKLSTGPFVRALIEDEAPMTKLLAYDSYLTVTELTEAWSKVTGKEAQLITMSAQDMHAKLGIPLEILDGPAFIAEFGYVAGVDGVIEPPQLRKKVVTPSYEDYLRSRSLDEILNMEMPQIK